MWQYNYSSVQPSSNELMHYGILGMRWGVRRTPEQLDRARREKGEKKQAKIVKKQDALREDNKYQKAVVENSQARRRAISAESLSSKVEKDELDRRIATDDFLTDWGKRRAQDKSFNLNARIKQLEDEDLRSRSDIANALRRMDINNTKISQLDEKYIRIGKKYLGQD